MLLLNEWTHSEMREREKALPARIEGQMGWEEKDQEKAETKKIKF